MIGFGMRINGIGGFFCVIYVGFRINGRFFFKPKQN